MRSLLGARPVVHGQTRRGGTHPSRCKPFFGFGAPWESRFTAFSAMTDLQAAFRLWYTRIDAKWPLPARQTKGMALAYTAHQYYRTIKAQQADMSEGRWRALERRNHGRHIHLSATLGTRAWWELLAYTPLSLGETIRNFIIGVCDHHRRTHHAFMAYDAGPEGGEVLMYMGMDGVTRVVLPTPHT